jgi:hypothetical protein
MNNPGCLRSEAARTCLLIGPDTYPRDWCLQSFDDDNCECQSMGVPLNVGPGASMVLKGGPKSYSFRVVCQPSTVVSIAEATTGRLYRYKGMEMP